MAEELPEIPGYETITPEQFRAMVHVAVMTRMKSLGWERMTKGMSAAEVLRASGVDQFANEVADYLSGGDRIVLQRISAPAAHGPEFWEVIVRARDGK